MEMLPNDVRQHRFKKSMRGYDPEEVDQFLEHIATVLEEALTARQKAEEAVGRLDGEIERFRDQENALKKAVLTVEQAMNQARESSLKESDGLRRQAEQQARQIIQEAELEARRLEQDLKYLKETRQNLMDQIRAFCRAQIQTIDNLEQPERVRQAALEGLMPKTSSKAAASSPEPRTESRPEPQPEPEPAPEPEPVGAKTGSSKGTSKGKSKPWKPARISRVHVDSQDDDDEATVAYPPPLVPAQGKKGSS